MVAVSWNDVMAFCGWLTTEEARPCRLPTEAEWEYACRAGTATRYFCGDDPMGLERVANLADASLRRTVPLFEPCKDLERWDDRFPFTAPVGQFQPNGFGLHDVYGNVQEWCADWYHGGYYANSPLADPQGPSAG